MLKYLSLLFILFPFLSLAQDSIPVEEPQLSPEEQYAINIKKEYLDGVYIPMDLEDSFVELKALAEKGSTDKFVNASEEVVSRKLHFGIGRWIAKNWKLYEGSRYSHHLRNLGLHHPDDMIQLSIIAFHRHLNNKPLHYKKYISVLVDKRKEEMDKRLAERKILKEFTRKREKNR